MAKTNRTVGGVSGALTSLSHRNTPPLGGDRVPSSYKFRRKILRVESKALSGKNLRLWNANKKTHLYIPLLVKGMSRASFANLGLPKVGSIGLFLASYSGTCLVYAVL